MRRASNVPPLEKGMNTAPSPPPKESMSPPLPDDIISEILRRVPPDDPETIVRASAVCKAWWRILADPAFSGRYRAHHRGTTAPMLGFLHHPRDHEAPRFVPTTSFRLPTPDRHMRHVWDCCHGRVLLYDYAIPSATKGFVVWDPITGDQHHIPHVPDCFSNAALICTDSGDHRDCSGAPFVIAFVGVEYYEDYGYGRDAYGDLYLSETRKWNRNDNVHLYDAKFDLERDRPAAHVGDSLYFVGTSGILLRFWYGPLLRLGALEMLCSGIPPSETLTLIEPPAKSLGKVIVTTAEGGGLGLACLKRNRIALWTRETIAGPKGDSDIWVKQRTINLNRLIPLSNPKRLACLSGVIPGDANVIFVSTEDGVFKIKLGPLLQVKKVSEMGTDVKIIYPFVSFYTETLLQRLASSKLPASEGCDLSGVS